MISTHPKAVTLKAALDGLIHAASHSDINMLDRIYHDDMKILMLAPDGTLNTSDKAAFIDFVKAAIGGEDKPNTWAKYHSVSVDDDNDTGHIFLSRKNNLMGTERDIMLSIDFVFEDDRWQIIREVIVVGAETGA